MTGVDIVLMMIREMSNDRNEHLGMVRWRATASSIDKQHSRKQKQSGKKGGKKNDCPACAQARMHDHQFYIHRPPRSSHSHSLCVRRCAVLCVRRGAVLC